MFALSGGAGRCFQMGRRGGGNQSAYKDWLWNTGLGRQSDCSSPVFFRTARLLFGFHLSSICNHFLEKFQEAAVY